MTDPPAIRVRRATPADADTVLDILAEATRWMEDAGMPMWLPEELAPEKIVDGVQRNEFVIADCGGDDAGTLRFQTEDRLFWPDTPQDEAAYIHRFAVRRAWAGKGVSTALLQWAVDETRALNRSYLRLDCQASRPKLRGVYERFGFRFHSERQVGPFHVARYEYAIKADAR